jgi:hypothetical protein
VSDNECRSQNRPCASPRKPDVHGSCLPRTSNGPLRPFFTTFRGLPTGSPPEPLREPADRLVLFRQQDSRDGTIMFGDDPKCRSRRAAVP